MEKKTTRSIGADAPGFPSRRLIANREAVILAALAFQQALTDRLRRHKPMDVTDSRTGLALNRGEVRRRFSRGLMLARCGLLTTQGGRA